MVLKIIKMQECCGSFFFSSYTTTSFFFPLFLHLLLLVQGRQPSTEGTPRNLFLWGQSIWIIASLLMDSLLHINELDIIRRHLPSYNRPRKGGRYSAFQVSLPSAGCGGGGTVCRVMLCCAAEGRIVWVMQALLRHFKFVVI